MPAGLFVDAEGEPITYRVKGIDRASPEAIFNCKIEVRPGGNMVAVVYDSRPVTTSAPAVVESYQEAEDQRQVRVAEYAEQEKAAAAMERASKEQPKEKSTPTAAA